MLALPTVVCSFIHLDSQDLRGAPVATGSPASIALSYANQLVTIMRKVQHRLTVPNDILLLPGSS